jgi:lysozyme family protein
MTTVEGAQNALREARDALNARRRATTDEAEKATLAAEVERINDSLTRLALEDLRAASLRVSAAADAVESLLRTARVNVFDDAIDASLRPLAEAAIKLSDEASKAFSFDGPRALDTPDADDGVDVAAPAPDVDVRSARPANARAPAAAADASSASGLPPIVVGRKLAELSADYDLCWTACAIRPDRHSEVQHAADRLLRGKERYLEVGRETGVPWQLIGLMHGLECGYDFNKHLHNGDSLRAATTRVPPGRPANWVPGSRWETSAIDAIQLKNLHAVQTWSLPRVLYALEAFNGFGYRGKGIRSPYLWSGSNLYEKGKYVRDHVYDPNAVSRQVGSAVLLKHLAARSLWP